MKNLFALALAGLVATTLVSCNNDDECYTPLQSFKLSLLDSEDEDIYAGEEPAYDSEDIRLYYINADEEEEEVEFNFRSPEGADSYIESLALAEESLGGETEFFLEIAEGETIELIVEAEKVIADGCTTHPYTDVQANGEELSEDDGIYSYALEATETE